MDGYYNWTSISDNVTLPSSKPYPSYPTHKNISDLPEPMSFNVVTAVVYSIVFIVGLLGNTLVIYVVVRYSNMKTITNMYILNLALADELYILGIPFLGTSSVLSYWPYGGFFCKVYMTADAMCQFSSTFCLTVMSIDRYMAVVHPGRSANWRKPQEEFNTCNITWPEPHDLWAIAFILYTSILGFFGPLVVICLCYLLIVIKVRSAGVRAGRTRWRRSERKVTRMVVIIVLVFVLCWLPFFTTNIFNLIHIIPESNAAIYFFLVILTYVNSCANPILYGFLSDNFRQSFKKVLCIQKPNTAGNAGQMRGRPTSPKENHNPVSSLENDTQNGTMQSIQQPVQMPVIEDLDNHPFTTKTELNGQQLL
ncbi:hypothetical protein KUCAC02_008112 [Chaenocephalus aceratus]|uniref:Uncharacterized protein n=1 Tax=Chaenocephalus aceratus TaxID=36190 RepID=A0ACB9X7Q3_CHAAC|nr:hypothetical protein KUCAC02_008112 [Chaenocephalus aceratus]